MSKTSKIILVTIIATCILLGLGYAAITNVTLNIAGTASATVDSGNFKVRFTDNIEVSDNAYVTATRTGDTAATINVSGLTTAGDKVTATYEIVNDSIDLSSDLNVKATNSNANYFSVSSRLADKSLTAGSNTTVLVTVELLKTPIDADVSTNIGVTLNAIPVQPGEEGSSGLTNDFSKVPINGTLNEYGFFYNEAYSLPLEENGETYVISLVFYEDGTGRVYSDENLYLYLSADNLAISNNSITINTPSMQFSVTENGYQLVDQIDEKYDLNESFMDKMIQYTGELNEYGFYYDVPYAAGAFNATYACVLHEDSTMSYYENGLYTGKESITYDQNKIYISDEGDDAYFEVIDNGNIIVIGDFEAFQINPNFELTKGIYITENTETGEREYLDVFPDTMVDGDAYVIGDYVYIYTSEQWTMGLITDRSLLPEGYEFAGKTLEEYPYILSDINGFTVKNMAAAFKECVNLKVAPQLPYNVENLRATFEGCTSLTTVPYEIPYSVTDMTNTFKGCTSLEGYIEINSNNITSYEGCFEGVDMSKITLTGSASDEIKDLLGKTGNNYTPLIPE